MSDETTFLYVWIKSLTKIYCLLNSNENVSIEYFTEDTFIFQFFLTHFNLNCQDYRSDLLLKDNLNIMRTNIKSYLDSYGFNSVNLLKSVFNYYQKRDNKMKIWKIMFTITFLDDFSLLCKRFMQYNDKLTGDKSFINNENDVSILKYNQNVPKKLTIRSMIKSPILLKLSLHIANEILTECEVGYADLESLLHSNFNEACNESKCEEVYHIGENVSMHDKSRNNDCSIISFNNNKSEILRDEYNNEITNNEITNNDNNVTYGNLPSDRSNNSREDCEMYFKKNNNFKLNLNYPKKFLSEQIDDKSKLNITANNISDRSKYEDKSIMEDIQKNDNFEITLRKHFPSTVFAQSPRCEKCENSLTRIEELDKKVLEEKLLVVNLTNSIKKYEEENSNLNKYNSILVGEKNTWTTSIKSLEKRINILTQVEKQLIEKDTENIILNKKLQGIEEINNNLQEKIGKYEDQIQIQHEYKIKLKMAQNEIIKIKKENEILHNNNKKKELESSTNVIQKVYEFSIKNVDKLYKSNETEYSTKIDNRNSKNPADEYNNEVGQTQKESTYEKDKDNSRKTTSTESNGEVIHYIENLNIFNDYKYHEDGGMKTSIAQNRKIIDHLKKKLSESLNIMSNKDSQIKALEAELISTTTQIKKKEKLIKTLNNSLEEKVIIIQEKDSFKRWTYLIVLMFLIGLLINKTIWSCNIL